jgi:flagellar biosynthesis protein FliP
MQIRSRLLWFVWVLGGLVMPLPAVHAQTMTTTITAVLIAPESFWVKRGAGNSAVRGVTTASGGNKVRAKAHDLGTGLSTVGDTAGAKKNDSIASELAGTKSVPWAIVFGLTLLTLLPALLLSMTPMVRLLVVFHFLRQALGTQTAPSNQILMGLAMMMTWFLMQPVLLEVEQTAVAPYSAGTITGEHALDLGVVPVKRYMLRYAREKDLAVFASAGMVVRPNKREDLPIQVVVPAYILSELKAGFQIGAVLFLPFLLVDLVVASITTSIGMMQLPPVVISTPLKILLFVMVDGWSLLADQLIKSF